MVPADRQQEIRDRADDLHSRLLEHYREVHRPNLELKDIVPISLEVLTTRVLGVGLRNVYSIPGDPAVASGVKTVIAGLFDRTQNLIEISWRFGRNCSRFTLAHEIGHFVLHETEVVLHRDRVMRRDRPLFSPGFDPTRPIVEREADRFAGDLLMPQVVLRDEFLSRFGAPINGRRPNPELAGHLSVSQGSHLDPVAFSHMKPFERAMIIAKASCFKGRTFDPLSERFLVSDMAAAIQLGRLGLVA